MHNYIRRKGTNILKLIDEFMDITFYPDCSDGPENIKSVIITDTISNDSSKLQDNMEEKSYWGGQDTAYVGTFIPGKTTKAFQNALKDFLDKRKDWKTFKSELNIGFGRKSSKVTCPKCESSISLKYGHRFKNCPVCGSTEIISSSNWKRLETKNELMKKSAIKLETEIGKLGGCFVGGFGYHD